MIQSLTLSLHLIKNGASIINTFCIPESFNLILTFHTGFFNTNYVNSQHDKTNLKSDFVLKNWL